MLELLREIGAFVDRMNVYKKDDTISDEIKKIIVTFLAELLKAIISLSTFMEANTTGAPSLPAACHHNWPTDIPFSLLPRGGLWTG